jgi:hypothetical protein
MRFPAVILALLASWTPCLAAPRPDTAEAVKKAIQKIYDDQSKAWMKRDAKALEKLFAARTTSDFTAVSDGVKRTRKDVIGSFAAIIAKTPKVVQYSIKVQSVKVQGAKATVVTTGKVIADVIGEDAKTHRLDMDQAVTTQWAKIAGSWMAKSSVSKTTRMTIDGREVPRG